MKAKGAIRWRLKIVMSERRIKVAQLAELIKVSESTVTTWRACEYMPEINEKRWIQIVAAINKLCDVNGFPSKKIDLWDLIEFCPDEQRDFDPLEYQYASGDARKKSVSKKSSQESDDSTPEKKEPIAA
jgi:DNA-binding Xre family transcriptional regulator